MASDNTDLLMVSSSPHAHSGASIRRIMLDVLLALFPATAASLWFFRLDALRLLTVCLASCILCEWLCRKAMKRNNTLGDLSAAVTGLLLALTLPPSLPSWMAAAGSVFAIGISKQVFGGLGRNPFNPALAGRAFMLVSFTGAMTTWSQSPWLANLSWTAPGEAASGATPVVDALTSATPLGYAKAALKTGDALGSIQVDWAMLQDFLFGANLNGSIGETCAAALLLGGIYLLARRVISWHIPVSFIGTVFLYALVMKLLSPVLAPPPMVHVLSGGLFLGAFFMATDMVTSPITKKGQLIFGIGCGLVTMLIRTAKNGAYPEGVCFSILVMNALVPLINRFCRNRVFGTGKPAQRRTA